jgi:hypothetical protein
MLSLKLRQGGTWFLFVFLLKKRSVEGRQQYEDPQACEVIHNYLPNQEVIRKLL